jgi:hypothetical protein
MSLNLRNPGRPIEAGVILMGTTEILDVIPIDFLGCIGKTFVDTGMLQLRRCQSDLAGLEFPLGY